MPGAATDSTSQSPSQKSNWRYSGVLHGRCGSTMAVKRGSARKDSNSGSVMAAWNEALPVANQDLSASRAATSSPFAARERARRTIASALPGSRSTMDWYAARGLFPPTSVEKAQPPHRALPPRACAQAAARQIHNVALRIRALRIRPRRDERIHCARGAGACQCPAPSQSGPPQGSEVAARERFSRRSAVRPPDAPGNSRSSSSAVTKRGRMSTGTL